MLQRRIVVADTSCFCPFVSFSASYSSTSSVCHRIFISIRFAFLVLLLLLQLPNDLAQRREHANELRAVKGQLFVHMLHSAYFFPQTVDVKWSVSSQGRPTLPHWLHLFPSRHRSIAFLVGTPVSPYTHFRIHVIARRMDSFKSVEQSFSIVTNEEPRFNGSTQELAEIKLTNVDAEELLWGVGRAEDKLKSIERAIHSTFRGRNVNPYIFNILPGMANTPTVEVFHQLRHRIVTGAIIQIGTQRHFHPNVQQLARGMQLNPEYCVQNKLIPMDRHFRHQFIVDWCKFNLRNVTLLKELDGLQQQQRQQQQQTSIEETPKTRIAAQRDKNAVKQNGIVREEGDNENGRHSSFTILPSAAENGDGITQMERKKMATGLTTTTTNLLLTEHKQMPVPPVYYIWESVLVFPLLAVFCLLCILCLSFIFFGRREGQHWRDFKTPKNQLEQYLDLRETQRQLREMSQQRQLLAMNGGSGGREQSEALSIGTFLRPRDPPQSNQHSENHQSVGEGVEGGGTVTGRQQTPRQQRTGTDERDAGGSSRCLTSPPGGYSSIGKQTVAEAARANGTAPYLYRHPIGLNYLNEDDEEEGEWMRNDEGGGRGGGSEVISPMDNSKWQTATGVGGIEAAAANK